MGWPTLPEPTYGNTQTYVVRGMSTANIADLTAFTVAGVDGLTYAAGERIYLAAQSTGAQNGIYVVGAVSGGTAALTRSSDWPSGSVIKTGSLISVDAGTLNLNTLWQITNAGDVTVATTTPTIKQLDADSPDVTKIHHVRGMSTANIADLTAFTVAGVDGLTYAAGERILLKDQSTGAQNGIYVVGAVSGGTAALTRAADWRAAATIPTGSLIVVDAGTVGFKAIMMINNTGAVTVATTTPTFFPIKNNGVQALSGAGAVNLTTYETRVTSTGAAEALTLADSTIIGLEKLIVHAVDGGSSRLTAGGALHLGDGIATITMADVRDWILLRWNGTSWFLKGFGGTGVTFT